MLFQNIVHLLYKEFLLEFRKKSAINAIIIYLVGSIFICYLSFSLKSQSLNPETWNALFWIISLFSAINGIAKSFMQENESRSLYYYTLTSPESIIISKILYNFLLMIILMGLSIVIYSIVLGNSVVDMPMFLLSILLGALGFSSTLTMVSSIASKANNSSVLMAVLSFPVIIPMLLLLIRVSNNALQGFDRSFSMDHVYTLLAIDMIVVTISYLLFPFLWRS